MSLETHFEKNDVIKTNTLIWTVDKQSMADCSNSELRTDKSSPESDCTDTSEPTDYFKIKIIKYSDNDIRVFYLSLNTLFLKLMCSIDNIPMINDGEYETVQANKWQYLDLLDTGYLSTVFHVRDSFKLKLVLMVVYDVKFKWHNFPVTRLSDDLENLLRNGLFSDVTMKSVEEAEYKVHKNVLASRSAVLKAHFEHNTTECFTNIVESPFESEVLQQVLTFIYSDTAPRVNEMPEKLLAAADYYQLSGLKIICGESLHNRLTVDNALETLLLADLHSASILKQLTLGFIKEEIKLIKKTEAWANLTSIETIKSILDYVTSDETY